MVHSVCSNTGRRALWRTHSNNSNIVMKYIFFILIYALSLSVEYNQQIDPFLSHTFFVLGVSGE